QESRSNRSLWYVLLADQQSYFNFPAAQPSTNKVARTNTPSVSSERQSFSIHSTNVVPARPGLIAELTIPEDAETSRRVLSSLGIELKSKKAFARVDLLSEYLRCNASDPKFILPDRHYALVMDFTADFEQPARVKRLPQQPRGSTRPRSRPSSS